MRNFMFLADCGWTAYRLPLSCKVTWSYQVQMCICRSGHEQTEAKEAKVDSAQGPILPFLAGCTHTTPNLPYPLADLRLFPQTMQNIKQPDLPG